MKYKVERISFLEVTLTEYCEVEAPDGLTPDALQEWMWDEQYDMDWLVDSEEVTDMHVDQLDWVEYA